MVFDDLLERSELYLANPPHSNIFSTSGNMGWRNLDVDGRRLQSRALDEYERLNGLALALLRTISTAGQKKFKKADKTIRKAIDQHGMTWWKNKTEVYGAFSEALENIVSLIEGLYDGADGNPVIVPDTNALLFNVDLDKWTFPDMKKFTIVLTPTVLAELDELKVHHRNEDVRKKAEGLITRIKGYRNRGELLTGAVLRKDVSQIRSIALEPNMRESLPWLDPDNKDDRFIASVIEVMRHHPHSPVVLITRDINMQNKASFASLPFDEPPSTRSRAKTGQAS